MDIIELVNICVNRKASDLHVSTGLSPFLRIDGELHPLSCPVLESHQVKNIFYKIMTQEQRQQFESMLQIDFAYQIPGLARFRINIFNQDRGIAGVMRLVPDSIPTLDQLDLPKILQDICKMPNGLVLVTGSTGSGKTTTLAAMIDFINTTDAKHILTLEDPIEFVHISKKSLINQREVYHHARSFDAALQAGLREDPDIILLGEMRDLATMRLALTAAETGHLVFATLHTVSAAKTINRIIDVFPATEKPTVRTLLSESLQAVICQSLLKRIGGGRVAALEIMLCTAAIRNLIREDKTSQIFSTIQISAGLGMQTRDNHIKELINQGLLSA